MGSPAKDQVLLGSQAQGRSPSIWIMAGQLLCPFPFMVPASLRGSIWGGGSRGHICRAGNITVTLVTSKQTYRVGREGGGGRGTAETPWLWDHPRFGLSRIDSKGWGMHHPDLSLCTA